RVEVVLVGGQPVGRQPRHLLRRTAGDVRGERLEFGAEPRCVAYHHTDMVAHRGGRSPGLGARLPHAGARTAAVALRMALLRLPSTLLELLEALVRLLVRLTGLGLLAPGTALLLAVVVPGGPTALTAAAGLLSLALAGRLALIRTLVALA